MSAAAKVGIFMIAILAIVAFFVLRIEDISVGREGELRARLVAPASCNN
ncbi:MAG: hypothetical protein R3338_00545 [Thermoanaerobaculia bacterium]|nr:hypothetical protein [Thermoanaerobaculia bacterium]